MGSDPIRIPLHALDGSVRAYTVIDAEDADFAEYRWSLCNSGYAVRIDRGGTRPRQVRLHREILGLRPGDPLQGDHINRDRLDNRRNNLRVVTARQNKQNRPPRRDGSSRYRGVDWLKARNKWRASARMGERHFHLGLYEDEDEAGRVASEWRSQHMTHSVEAA